MTGYNLNGDWNQVANSSGTGRCSDTLNGSPSSQIKACVIDEPPYGTPVPFTVIVEVTDNTPGGNFQGEYNLEVNGTRDTTVNGQVSVGNPVRLTRTATSGGAYDGFRIFNGNSGVAGGRKKTPGSTNAYFTDPEFGTTVPTGLTGTCAQPLEKKVSLDWEGDTGTGPTGTGYDVFRDGILVGSVAESAYLDTGLPDGASYSYQVRSYRHQTAPDTFVYEPDGSWSAAQNYEGISDYSAQTVTHRESAWGKHRVTLVDIPNKLTTGTYTFKFTSQRTVAAQVDNRDFYFRVYLNGSAIPIQTPTSQGFNFDTSPNPTVDSWQVTYTAPTGRFFERIDIYDNSNNQVHGIYTIGTKTVTPGATTKITSALSTSVQGCTRPPLYGTGLGGTSRTRRPAGPGWRFDDLDPDAQSYVFPINPNDMSNPVPSRSIEWNRSPNTIRELDSGRYSGTREARKPHPWTFSGVIRSEAEDDAFKLWVGYQRTIYVTTHLGQKFKVRLLAYRPKQTARPRNRHAPYRMTYTMDCLIFEDVTP